MGLSLKQADKSIRRQKLQTLRPWLQSLSLRVRVFHSNTRPSGRLLFPCFKTGERETFCQVRRGPEDRRTRRIHRSTATACSDNLGQTRAHAASHSDPRFLRHREHRTRTTEAARPLVLPPTQPDVASAQVQWLDAAHARTRTSFRISFARGTVAPPDCSLTLTASLSVHVSSFGLFSLSFMSAFQISFTVLLRYLSTPYI